MGDAFKSPKSMLGRAKRHLAELEAQVKAFMRDKPWSMVVEKDANGTTNLLKIKFTKRLTDDMPNVVFDCASNLRSVLDQIAYAILRGTPAFFGRTGHF